MNKEERQVIVGALNERLAIIKCPICFHDKSTLLDGYINQEFQHTFSDYEPIFDKSSIPITCVICDNCGFMRHHALGCLGLLPKRSQND